MNDCCFQLDSTGVRFQDVTGQATQQGSSCHIEGKQISLSVLFLSNYVIYVIFILSSVRFLTPTYHKTHTPLSAVVVA